MSGLSDDILLYVIGSIISHRYTNLTRMRRPNSCPAPFTFDGGNSNRQRGLRKCLQLYAITRKKRYIAHLLVIVNPFTLVKIDFGERGARFNPNTLPCTLDASEYWMTETQEKTYSRIESDKLETAAVNRQERGELSVVICTIRQAGRLLLKFRRAFALAHRTTPHKVCRTVLASRYFVFLLNSDEIMVLAGAWQCHVPSG